MKELDKIAESLFEKIRSRFDDISLGDKVANQTEDPREARFFNFDFSVDGVELGNVTISIADGTSLKMYYSKDLSDDLQPEQKIGWENFLRSIRKFAKRNLLSFEPRDISRSIEHKDLKQSSVADGTYSSDEVELKESKLYGTRKTSFQECGPVKIIVRHSAAIDPERRGARSRKINSIFLETHEGERFKLPENSLVTARAMARHISEGGAMHDDFGSYILKISEECKKLRPFKAAMIRRVMEDEETQQMVEAAFAYHRQLHDTLQRISGRKGYKHCKEEFAANPNMLMDSEEVDVAALKERFVKKVFNDKLEAALPLVQKAYKMKKHNELAQQFESWANGVIEEGLNTGVEELLELFREEIPVGVDAINATETLESTTVANNEYYDELVDKLVSLSQEDPDADARETILYWMQDEMPYQYQAIVSDVGDVDQLDDYDANADAGEFDGDQLADYDQNALAEGPDATHPDELPQEGDEEDDDYEWQTHPDELNENLLAEYNDDEHPAKSAIIRRIMIRGIELLGKYGPDKVLRAVESVCESIPYDLEEIGSSDVSIWVKQVERELEAMGPEELTEVTSTSLEKVLYKGQQLELDQWPDGTRSISNAKTGQMYKTGSAEEIMTVWQKIKAAASATAHQMTGGAMGKPIQEEDQFNEALEQMRRIAGIKK